jgi:DnaJ-class molecular chaperone
LATGQARHSTQIASEVDDYYATLGVPYGATHQEISRAYRRAMRGTHPDRQKPERRAAAEERAKLINRAFMTLSNTELRRAYDAEIKSTVVQDQIMGRYVGGFATPNGASDPFAESVRRPRSKAEREDQRRADRSATVSLLFVFAVVTGFVLLLLILSSVIDVMFEHLI